MKKRKNKGSSYDRSTFGDDVEKVVFTTLYHTQGSSRPNKSPWSIKDAEAWEVFKKAYIHEVVHCKDGIIGELKLDYVWMNDDCEGLCSFDSYVDDKSGLLKLRPIGKEGEQFAYFPKLNKGTDKWHGYPERGNKVGKRLAKYWVDKKFISLRDYKLIRQHRI